MDKKVIHKQLPYKQWASIFKLVYTIAGKKESVLVFYSGYNQYIIVNWKAKRLAVIERA